MVEFKPGEESSRARLEVARLTTLSEAERLLWLRV
jgi:hypothetical protein